jgi:hypothetical protein
LTAPSRATRRGHGGQTADCLAKRADTEAVAAIERSQIPDWHQQAERYLAACPANSPPSKERHARAREVVEEGERLMRAGDCRRACRASARSRRRKAPMLCLPGLRRGSAALVRGGAPRLAERYLQRRGDYAPAEFAARIAALDALKYRLEAERRSGDSFGATFFRRAIRAHGVDACGQVSIRGWRSPVVDFADAVSRQARDLIFEIPTTTMAHL